MTLNSAKTLLAGAITAAVASGAFAQNNPDSEGPPPNLTLQEKAMYVVVEQVLSIVAASIDRNGCGSANYSFSGEVFSNGSGGGTIDDLRVDVTVDLNDFRGTFLRTFIPSVGEIGSTEFRQVPGNDHVGSFAYSRRGEIFYGDADFELFRSLAWEPYDEHIIKDFIASDVTFVIGGQPTTLTGVVDRGLEVITKLDYPRAKWRQVSDYYRADGGLGILSIQKVLIAPNNAASCEISITNATIDDFGGAIQWSSRVNTQPGG